jgi:hypothetical protein
MYNRIAGGHSSERNVKESAANYAAIAAANATNKPYF